MDYKIGATKLSFLEEDPISYFNIMCRLPPFKGSILIPSNYGYIVPFREVIRPELPRMKYFVNYKGIIYNSQNNRFLTGGLDSSGYRQVTLSVYKPVQYNILVHHLVMAAFNCDKSKEGILDLTIDHIDGNRLNNDFRNLRYMSRSMNSMHIGFNIVTTTPLKVFEDIANYYLMHPNMCYSDIADMFKTDYNVVRRFLQGKTAYLKDIYDKCILHE